MLTLHQRRCLNEMGIDVWRKRDEPQEAPISLLSYWAIDVFVSKHNAVFSLVCAQGKDLEGEKALFDAIAGAIGDKRSDVRVVQDGLSHPILALGDAVVAGVGNQAQLRQQFDYTIEQLLQKPALKRDLWRQLKQFVS